MMGARVGLVAIGLWTTVQSLVYCGFAVAAALAHRCVLDMSGGGLFVYQFYTWYLRDERCGFTDWDWLAGEPIGPEQWPTMPPITAVARRTDIIAIVYFAISCVWLLASLGLLLVVSKCCAPKRALVYGWMTATALVIALDFAASGVFLADLIRSLNVNTFLWEFEISPPPSGLFAVPKYMLVAPSALLFAITTRGIVFWIMNVVLLFLVVPMARRSVFKDLDEYDDADIDDATVNGEGGVMHYSRNNNIVANKHVSPVLSIVGNRYDDQAIVAQHHSTPYAVEHRPNQQPQITQSTQQSPQPQNVTEHRYFEPLKGRSPSPNPQELQHQQAIAAAVQHNYHNRASKIPMLQGSLLEQQRITIERPHLRSSRGPLASSGSYGGGGSNNVVNNASNNDPAGMRANRASTMLADSHRHSHYAAASSPSPGADGLTVAAAATAPPPDELRGQLPWSYFKSPSDITGPKRTFTQLRDDEDLPPVPVPDYTLHFPRKDRPSTNSSDEGAWAGPEQRY